MKLKEILQHSREREYTDTNEAEKEPERIWDETGYPSAKQVEESDELSRWFSATHMILFIGDGAHLFPLHVGM